MRFMVLLFASEGLGLFIKSKIFCASFLFSLMFYLDVEKSVVTLEVLFSQIQSKNWNTGPNFSQYCPSGRLKFMLTSAT